MSANKIGLSSQMGIQMQWASSGLDFVRNKVSCR